MTTTLLFLDDYHVGDPLFLADLGRRLSTLAAAGRTVIVHRVGESLGRALEGTDPTVQAAVTERAIRETNQGIARRLIEEGVPAVAVQGSDRGLIRLGENRDTSKTDWLMRVVETGTIPVVSPLAAGKNGIEMIDPVRCAIAIARLAHDAGDVQAVVFCSNRKGGLYSERQMLESVAISNVHVHAGVIDVEAAIGLVDVVDRLIATNSVWLAKGSTVTGTLLERE